MAYQLLLSKETLNKILQYKQNLEKGLAMPGKFFLEELSKQEKSISEMDITTFTQLLIQSKNHRFLLKVRFIMMELTGHWKKRAFLGMLVSICQSLCTMMVDMAPLSRITQSQFPVIWLMCQVPSWLRAVGRLQI